MGKESSGRSKLTEFMTDHVFANKNGNEFSPVVHANGITHHLGRNGRDSFMAAIFFAKCSSIKGPFLTERAIVT